MKETNVFAIEGRIMYSEMVKLQKKLETRGIEARIVDGGAHLYPKSKGQINAMFEVCKEWGLTPRSGYTTRVDNVMNRKQNK